MIENKGNYDDDGDRLLLYVSGSNSHGQLGIMKNNQGDISKFEQTHKWEVDLPLRQNCDQDTSQNKSDDQASCFSISSSLGGRHSLFLINWKLDQYSLYSCGDSSKGQLGPHLQYSASKSKINAFNQSSLSLNYVERNLDESCGSNVCIQNDYWDVLQQIDYQKLISQVSNIKEDFREILLQSYQPVQVAACWETSFLVLSPFSKDCSSNLTTLENKSGIMGNFMEANGYDDCIIAFGSNDFDLRGSRDVLQDVVNPNLVDLPKTRSTINTRRKIKLSSGCRHIIAMVLHTDSDEKYHEIELIGWGAARHGQLGSFGNLDKLPRSTQPTLLSITIPKTMDFSSIMIALGNQHTVIVCPTRIWCWGSNRNNQIPPQLQEIQPSQILELKASWNATFILSSTDNPNLKKLLGYGNNLYGQLGIEDHFALYSEHVIDSSYSGLSAGSEHVLITRGDDEVWGWGWNEHGNLGHQYGCEPQQTCQFGKNFQTGENELIQHVSAGCATSFIICYKKKQLLNSK